MTLPIYMIVAFAQNGIIGRDGDMPWRLSTDLKRFKALTLGKPVVVGRKTWDSLGKPLPGRANIVITRDTSFAPDGAMVVHSLSQALELAQQQAEVSYADAVFIIGGGEIFKQAMPVAQKMYVTEILTPIEGDTFFPSIDMSKWNCVHTEDIPAGEKDSHPTRFHVYERQ